MSQASTTPGDRTLNLPTAICVSFGIGTVGVSIVLNTVSVYFPTLMSTVLGVSPAIAGLLLTGSKLYDIVIDVIIGGASDRTTSRWGRRRPYLLAGALTSFASLLVIFLVPTLGGDILIAYMAVALIIYSTGYALFNVPYLAMPAEMTDSYQQRLHLVSFRTAFVGLGQLLSLAVTAALIEFGGGGAPGYRLMGTVMACIALLTMLICFWGTAKARTVAPGEHGLGFSWAGLKSLAGNRPLVMLMGAKLTQYLAFGIMQPANLLFLLNVLKTGYAGMVHLSVAQNIAVFASMPMWVRLGRRFGKRNCYMAAVMIMIPACLSWYWTGPGVEMWEIWTRSVVFGIGSGGSLLMSTSMLPDAMHYDRHRTGLHREGVVASLYCINEKLGFAIGALALGAALSAGGYIATTGGQIIDQAPAAIEALFTVKAFIPALALSCGLVMIWCYNLDQKTLDAASAAARA
ncbi:MAG: MFS transporter [Alphaproteobacteria bacterium]|nr:MFS transporter [Alphaproteobacteria bacterium]